MSTLTVAREPVRDDVLQAARDFASSFHKPYVAYPATKYQLNIVVGDWDFTNYTFDNARMYSIAYVPANGNVDSYMHFSIQSSGLSGALENPYGVLTYSSAGYSVNLCDKGGVVLATAGSIGLTIFLCWFIVRDIFSNVSRH